MIELIKFKETRNYVQRVLNYNVYRYILEQNPQNENYLKMTSILINVKIFYQQMNNTFRLDIQGLRAIAVIFVILFPQNFYFSGDIWCRYFFVISGYLITQIIIKILQKTNFR